MYLGRGLFQENPLNSRWLRKGCVKIGESKGRLLHLVGTCPVPPKRDNGAKGHNMNETSFARILLATACPGSPAMPAPA